MITQEKLEAALGRTLKEVADEAVAEATRQATKKYLQQHPEDGVFLDRELTDVERASLPSVYGARLRLASYKVHTMWAELFFCWHENISKIVPYGIEGKAQMECLLDIFVRMDEINSYLSMYSPQHVEVATVAMSKGQFVGATSVAMAAAYFETHGRDVTLNTYMSEEERVALIKHCDALHQKAIEYTALVRPISITVDKGSLFKFNFIISI